MSRFPIGAAVRCRLPGKRTFASVVVRYRADQEAVDVKDPRNGGLRTIREEYVTAIIERRRRRG